MEERLRTRQRPGPTGVLRQRLAQMAQRNACCPRRGEEPVRLDASRARASAHGERLEAPGSLPTFLLGFPDRRGGKILFLSLPSDRRLASWSGSRRHHRHQSLPDRSRLPSFLSFTHGLNISSATLDHIFPKWYLRS